MTDEFESIKSVPTRIDLKAQYPIAFRTIFERSFWFLLAEAIVLYGYITATTDMQNNGLESIQIETAANDTLYYVAKIVSIICILKLLYEALNHYMYSYIIELEHLTITRGVFQRTRASFPIAKVNDVSLKRNLLQLIFGIYVVDVLTASPEIKYGEVYGLNSQNAIDLQSYLLTLVETTLPQVRNNAGNEIIDGTIEEGEIPHLLHDK